MLMLASNILLGTIGLIMGTVENLEDGLSQLRDRQLFSHNEVRLVRSILPGEVNPALSWLMWSTFDIEPLLEPPIFESAFIFKVVNISEVFTTGVGGSIAPEIIESRKPTWDNAIRQGYEIRRTDLEVARVVVGKYAPDPPRSR